MTVGTQNHDPLRQAWHRLAEDARAGGDCPTAERIWAAAWGEAPLEDRREVVDHLATCPACAEAWRLAREIGREQDSSAADGGRSKEERPWLRPVLLAAAALFVAVIGLQVVDWQRTPDDAQYRDGATDAIVSLVPEDVPQPRNSLVLQWRAPEGSVAYDLRLTDTSLGLLARARDLSEPSFRVPPDRLATVPDGATLLWQVEAIFPDGSRLVSATFLVRIDGPSP